VTLIRTSFHFLYLHFIKDYYIILLVLMSAFKFILTGAGVERSLSYHMLIVHFVTVWLLLKRKEGVSKESTLFLQL
jgi:hypothetical protein